MSIKMSNLGPNHKLIFMIGGVMSGIGKGIVAASIGSILKSHGLKVNNIKLDPYLNVDAGTMNPFEHGETFVTGDGLEADLDLGHYERLTSNKTNKNSIVTSGKLYQTVITKERKGDYLGHTVQMIPHFTNEVIEFINRDMNKYDVTICEIGGTCTDIESMAYMETVRQIKGEPCNSNVLVMFLTYVPFLDVTKEFKSKPTQESIKSLIHLGINPDIVMCRYEKMDHKPTFMKKLALFSNIPIERIFLAPNVDNIYKLPYIYAKQNIHKEIFKILKFNKVKENLTSITKLYNTLSSLKETITINMIVKYGYIDAYISLIEALKHAAYFIGKDIYFNWIDVREMSKTTLIQTLKDNNNAMLVPGGFGSSGVENKILALNYARTNNIPTLGICYGMQMMAVEFARNVLGFKNANTQEIDPTSKATHVVHIINKDEKNLGGTMRLGNYEGKIKANTLASDIYGTKTFLERHRHRYEINTKYRKLYEEKGFVFSGTSGNEVYMEISEIKTLDFYVGVQYHPEFNSSIFKPNEVILAFMKEAAKYQFPKEKVKKSSKKSSKKVKKTSKKSTK